MEFMRVSSPYEEFVIFAPIVDVLPARMLKVSFEQIVAEVLPVFFFLLAFLWQVGMSP